MALYKAQKNIYFTSLNKDVVIGETIDLDKEYADTVNADLKPVFTDVEAVLVLVDEEHKLQNAELDSKLDTEAASDAMN
ncbi:hypothetical protein CYK11_07620 [Streptococcus anginosus]|jgi:hypothetical protein|uniref:Uncharacterized protein n=1 Tax=Streptococcus anginosus TaxID=1328 RepID=A0A412PL24_STRAP|nr:MULTISPECIES: hypothetical protein [Bacteria]KAA9252970.1 hypothetical protein F6I28_09320 [Streptococcus anginosus]KAA9309518.1 hypothetical protein F6H99_07615 [Streptococcus anginosus]MBU5589844.1 hypothetical protein [Streptococcus anginosus]MCW0964376.1 hypothetical protein [Streptococcus anginosus]MCW0978721.1 hypothetical protein [Streptococcus anginosus]